MNKLKNLFALFLVLGSVLISSAQTGNYFLTHYTPSHEKIDYLNFDIVQRENGVIYFANKSGIVEFDGRNWNVIETPGAIYTLSFVDGKQLYVGGLSGYGKLILNDQNSLSYQSISSELSQAKNIFASEAVGNVVYFLNESNLFIYSASTQKTDQVIAAEGDQVFGGLFEIAGSIYVTSENATLKLDNGKLVRSKFNFLNGDDIFFTDKLSQSDKILIGTSEDRIFIYDGKKASEIKIKDSEYLSSNVVVGGRWVNDKLIALGTLRGGVIFINTQTGATEEIISYYTGLPDNEVFALMCDRNQGIWVAHDYGFTRIAPSLPFRTFNHYPGLSGNLLCVSSAGNNVYVGTSVGLYQLIKEEIYTDETYYVTTYKKSSSKTTTKNKSATQENQSDSKRGLFGFLKKRNKTEEPAPKTTTADKKTTTKKQPKKIVETKTRRVLKALQYGYKKIDGIDGKVTNLAIVNGKLIASGIGGVFEVTGTKAVAILDEPVRTLFFSKSLKQLLISTYEDRVRTFSQSQRGWNETHLLDTLHEFVGNIFEDKIQNIWLCSRAVVTKVELLDNEISTISNIEFSTPVVDETTGFNLGNEVFVAASGAFHRYDVVEDKFVAYDSLPGPRKYFASSGTFWFNDGHQWRTVDSKLQSSLKLNWLGLFSDIRFLSMTSNADGLWLITSTNELYRFSAKGLITEANYPLLLKEVRGPETKLAPARKLSVDQRESALIFEFIQPDYISWQAVEYQYFIQGVSGDWSEWSSSNNVVNFPYLPSGDYRLSVKSRNLFGEVAELQTIDFKVMPPYWKQTWFYALEFIVFGSLVIMSMRLGGPNSKYRYVSRLLSILTVIMLIQFIQTAVSSMISVRTTPVIDFFIQVFIALLILPVEERFRRFMEGASEGKYELKGISKGIRKTTP